jgi:arylesterase / paraoxonase
MNVKLLIIICLLISAMQCSKTVPLLRPNDNSQACKKIEVAPGPEDFEIISSGNKNFLVISTHERREKNQLGKLFSIELDSKSLSTGNFQATELKVDKYPGNFRPHGISHSKFQGKNRLYVISHPRNNNDEWVEKLDPQHTIEVFEEGNKGNFTWKHIKTLSDSLLESPNDLFALPEERLLISNDMGSELNFTAVINLLFKRATTDITYYAENKFYPTNEKIPFGNGIWYEEESDDSGKIVIGKKKEERGTLYRSSHVDKSIYVYSARWVENHAPLLTLQYKIAFNGGPDNLYKNKYGFFTSVHVSDFQFLDHSKSPKNIAPSQIYEITDRNQTKLIYSDPGEEIPGASGAIRYGNKLFISQVFEDFLLVCDI